MVPVRFNQLYRCAKVPFRLAGSVRYVSRALQVAKIEDKEQLEKAIFWSDNSLESLSSPQLLTEEESDRLFSSVMLKVRCSDEAVLESYTQFVTRAAIIFEMNCSGKVVLPMHIEKRTVNKSPHIYRLHRNQFEQRTHGRVVQIKEVTGDTSDIFLEYIQRMKPEGVSLSVESTELERLPTYLQPPK